MLIRTKFNYGLIEYGKKPKRGDKVDVRRRNGEFVRKAWLGFIDVEEAKQRHSARPVKIKIYAYTTAVMIVGFNWQYVPEGNYLQGCLTPNGVYGVIKQGVPRII